MSNPAKGLRGLLRPWVIASKSQKNPQESSSAPPRKLPQGQQQAEEALAAIETPKDFMDRLHSHPSALYVILWRRATREKDFHWGFYFHWSDQHAEKQNRKRGSSYCGSIYRIVREKGSKRNKRNSKLTQHSVVEDDLLEPKFSCVLIPIMQARDRDEYIRKIMTSSHIRTSHQLSDEEYVTQIITEMRERRHKFRVWNVFAPLNNPVQDIMADLVVRAAKHMPEVGPGLKPRPALVLAREGTIWLDHNRKSRYELVPDHRKSPRPGGFGIPATS
ncbi:hypothetical protein N7462_009205 [Penicillium macrosclerotiorum]|uniref:uncharacterized protein n=1 Tax=Penicillium macrosclerotiorum TaxID=303699 RepID=UPI0025474340|nr:uncharacterized protein N7462_009205 [Penicillium macrosclerotiorum]KAJ5673766.1 hypothetical protein N7462_009205 [Penicillium macrosclerotiorum]